MLVFVLFEPGKFNKHKQKQSSGRCHAKSVGIYTVCTLCRFFQDLKSRTSSERYPAFFFYVAEKGEMFHSGFGYLTEKRGIENTNTIIMKKFLLLALGIALSVAAKAQVNATNPDKAEYYIPFK